MRRRPSHEPGKGSQQPQRYDSHQRTVVCSLSSRSDRCEDQLPERTCGHSRDRHQWIGTPLTPRIAKDRCSRPHPTATVGAVFKTASIFLAQLVVGLSCGGASQVPAASTEGSPPAADDRIPDDTGEDALDYDPESLVELSLVADRAALALGEPATLAAVLTIQEGWHVYWKNPGDSGLRTRIEVATSDGLEVGEPRFPGPVSFGADGDVINYGYAEQVLFPMEVRGAPGHAIVEVEARWLACRDDACVPGRGSASFAFDGSATPQAETISRVVQALPSKAFPTSLDVKLEMGTEKGQPFVAAEGPKGIRFEFFPSEFGAAKPVALPSATGAARSHARVLVFPNKAKSDALVVVAARTPSGEIHYVEIDKTMLSKTP